MNKYTPDSWTILRMVTPEETIYKVLAGWFGGLTYGDSWKLSSGIIDVDDFEGYYDLPQYSGSSYHCYKSAEHMSVIMGAMLKSWQEQAKVKGSVSIEAISMEHFIDEWYRNES